MTAIASSATLAPSAATALYTNPASATTVIGEIDIHNTSGSSITVVLWLAPSSAGVQQTATSAMQFTKLTLASNETVWLEPTSPYILPNTNDTIWAVASASGVNIQARGSTYQ